MTNTSIICTLFHDQLREASGRLSWLGLATVVLGIAAIVFPMISALRATLFVAWVFLLSGGFIF